MPNLVAPGGTPSKGPASVNVDFITVAPGVKWKSEFIDDDLFGDEYVFLFGMGVRKLTQAQRDKAISTIVPLLDAPAAECAFYAIADRVGAKKKNYQVSYERLSDFQWTLASGMGRFDLIFDPGHKSFGEDFSEYMGRKDDKEFADHRAVVAFIWPNLQSAARTFLDNKLLQYARKTPQPKW